MSKKNCEAAESVKDAILRMARAEHVELGKIGKNQLTHAEAYNIISKCDELFISV